MDPAKPRQISLKEARLREALRGVPLSDYDDRMLRHLAVFSDLDTVETLASWLDRVRQAPR